MEETEYLIVGAGVTGLSFANFSPSDDFLLIERESQPGGYCRTVKRSGYTWDQSGHFFHFRRPEIQALLVNRLDPSEYLRVKKRAAIYYRGRHVDYPFQDHIHQLPKAEFIDCLYHLQFQDTPPASRGLERFFYENVGKGIAERFLLPYNEKVYATDLSQLDPLSLGRFFPKTTLTDVIKGWRRPGDRSYNAEFIYPIAGAARFIDALLCGIDLQRISCSEQLLKVDADAHVAVTSSREIRYGRMISTIPFPALLVCSGERDKAEALTSSQVLAVNLGFDRKGDDRYHWLYFPEKQYPFYRVGYYDNVVPADRMSLYVEVAMEAGKAIDVDSALPAILDGLEAAKIVTGERVIARHHVVMNPAYVHITSKSKKLFDDHDRAWRSQDIYSIGRYGAWRYCSMEDNIAEARALAHQLEMTGR